MTRVGVVGLRWHASKHIEAIQRIEGVQIAAVCDLDPQWREKRAGELGVPAYENLAEMIRKEKTEVVFNVTGDTAHHDTTLTALRAGADVLCEKPLGVNAEEVRGMYRVAKENKRLLFAGLNRRFAPAYVRFQSAVAPHVGPGAVLYVEKFYGGFELSARGKIHAGYLTGIHQTDLAVWIGGKVKKIEGVSVTRKKVVGPKGGEGTVARVTAIFTHASGLRTFFVVGNRAGKVAEHPSNLERTYFSTDDIYVDQYDFSRVTVSYGEKSETVEIKEDELGFRAQAEAFLAAVRTRRLPCPDESYIEAHRVAFALPREKGQFRPPRPLGR